MDISAQYGHGQVYRMSDNNQQQSAGKLEQDASSAGHAVDQPCQYAAGKAQGHESQIGKGIAQKADDIIKLGQSPKDLSENAGFVSSG